MRYAAERVSKIGIANAGDCIAESAYDRRETLQMRRRWRCELRNVEMGG